jgi:hypothetical protein
MTLIVCHSPRKTRGAIERAVRALSAPLTICCLGLALGACSKCDVPNLLPHQAAPQLCHGTTPTQ